MAKVTIRLDRASDNSQRAFADYLNAHEASTALHGSVVEVDITSFVRCDEIARSITDFIHTQSLSGCTLHIDGPGGESLLYQLDTDDVDTTISGLLASCAFLQ